MIPWKEQKQLDGRQAEEDEVIKDGSLVILYESHDHMKAVRVAGQQTLQNRFGLFRHSDWLGKPFGSKVFASKGKGFVHLLRPTPELWTLVLPHRTQILYLADMSLVLTYLELRPGSIVLESGTGSGSLTHSLARAVAPTGRVLTFEYHQQRAELARLDFQKNGISHLVTVTVRDIQAEGFPDSLQGSADGVFLDLPGPWLAIPSAARSLKPDGHICSFSPCIEQVQRACETLASNGFTEIRTFEFLLRHYDVREDDSQHDLPSFGIADAENETSRPIKRRCSSSQVDGASSATSQGQNASSSLRASQDTVFECQAVKDITSLIDIEDGALSKRDETLMNGNANEKEKRKRRHGNDKLEISRASILARPIPQSRGHTGYLTFARKLV